MANRRRQYSLPARVNIREAKQRLARQQAAERRRRARRVPNLPGMIRLPAPPATDDE